jgi:hypothetical protein
LRVEYVSNLNKNFSIHKSKACKSATYTLH